MKKMQNSLMLVAVAAMTFAGCSKEDVSDSAQPGSGKKVQRSFVAEISTSRTTLNDAMTRMKWTSGDQLGFYTDVATDLNVASSTYADGAVNFTAEIDTKATKVYAYYPYFGSQMDKDTPRTHENVSLYIQEAQTQTEAGVLNGQWVGMYASAQLVEGQNTVLSFTPIASLIAFDIYDLENNGDKVSSITFTPAGGEKLNGQTIYNLETGVTTSTGSKTSASVTLTTAYAVPSAKPAATEKGGYIYLAVTPKVYAGGGTFTVATDKGRYEFETTNSIDLSNVYAVLTVPMNLAKVRTAPPTLTHIFYDDFSSVSGTSAIATLKVSPADYAYYYTEPYTKTGSIYPFGSDAIRMGVSGTTATLTTPALKLIEGTKNLKVTFYANGWAAGQLLSVTASTGTIKGGSALAMPAAIATSGTMDKNAEALFTVYVENADATTTLTFALDNPTVDKRFILTDLTVDVHDGPIVIVPEILADNIVNIPAAGATDETFTYTVKNDDNYTASVTCDGTIVTAASVNDQTKTVTYTVSPNADQAKRTGTITITLDDMAATSKTIDVEQNEAGSTTLDVAYTFNAKSGIGSGYGLKTNVAANNGVAWTVTFGQGTYVGTNSGNKNKCKLDAAYEKVGAPMGYTASQTQVVAIISESAMTNVGKVVVSGDTDNYNPQKISLVYSTDNTTYTLVETQNYSKTNGNTWEFTVIPSAYYAVVMQYSGGSYMRTNNLKIEFYSAQ